jgi:predicted nucleic acid-binding protein
LLEGEKRFLTTWLIDTALFKGLAPRASRRSTLQGWIEAHEEPIFLSVASLVELEAAIARVPAGQRERVATLNKWLEGFVSDFADRIHPVESKVAIRAGRLLPNCREGQIRHRFHDALLVATAQIYDHALLTKRDRVFGAWTRLEVASP